MPAAGDEGYERLIRCPYDKSHEIRKGRMQFHLEKCRKNFPSSQLTDCPFNKAHQIPKQELQYHIEEECPNRIIWERFTHETDSVDCPVRDLVPVNAASVPSGGESWDSCESTTSVLNNIRAEAENRPVLRSCQVASKATRKAFRKAERERFESVAQAQSRQPEYAASTSSVSSNNPLPRPKVQPNIPVFKQDPQKALATIAKTKTSVAAENLNLNSSQASGSVVPSETSSVISEYAASVSSNQMPFSYAAASQGRASRPLSVASNQTTDTSVMTALTSQHGRMPRVNGAMSNSSFTTASQGLATSRPQSSMSDYSMAESMMSAMSLSSARRSPAQRPTTAMNIAASAAAYIAPDADQEGFSQIPIPGLGRGRRAKAKN